MNSGEPTAADHYRILHDGGRYKDILKSLTCVGKEDLKEYEPEVRRYLSDPDAGIRAEAIVTLGTRWRLPEYLDTFEQLWRNDPDATVRAAALGSWISYYAKSNNHRVADELYKILKSDTYDRFMRAQALSGIGHVMGGRRFLKETGAIARISDSENIDDLVPWDEVDQLMQAK